MAINHKFIESADCSLKNIYFLLYERFFPINNLKILLSVRFFRSSSLDRLTQILTHPVPNPIAKALDHVFESIFANHGLKELPELHIDLNILRFNEIGRNEFLKFFSRSLSLNLKVFSCQIENIKIHRKFSFTSLSKRQ